MTTNCEYIVGLYFEQDNLQNKFPFMGLYLGSDYVDPDLRIVFVAGNSRLVFEFKAYTDESKNDLKELASKLSSGKNQIFLVNYLLNSSEYKISFTNIVEKTKISVKVKAASLE